MDTEEQRNIVKNTADKAGFKVMQVVSEPVAACLAYGLGQIEPSERYHCLVFRVGGLTMSVTMILVAGGCYTVLASKDFNIGGGCCGGRAGQYTSCQEICSL